MYTRSALALSGMILVSTLTVPLSADPPSAAAQCGGVLQDAFKERNLSIADAASLSTIHDNYCSASGQFNQTSAGIGLEAIIKQIPAKLTGNYNNTTEAFQNFCKNYDSYATSSSHTSLYTERVISRALDTFDTCVRLAGLGAYVTHKFSSPRLGSISIISGTRPVVLSGLQIDGDVSCETQLPGGKAVTTLTKDSNISVLGQLSVSCRRAARVGKDVGPEAALYDEAVIQVHTDLGETYDALWPQSERKSETDADRIAGEMAALRKELVDLKKANTELTANVATLSAWPKAGSGQLWGPGGQYAPAQGSAPSWKISDVWAMAGDKEASVICPESAPFMTGFKTFGNNFMVVRCRN